MRVVPVLGKGGWDDAGEDVARVARREWRWGRFAAIPGVVVSDRRAGKLDRGAREFTEEGSARADDLREPPVFPP